MESPETATVVARGVITHQEPAGWNQERARKVIRTLVRRIAPLFNSLHEFAPEDLESVALDAAKANWHKYDPWRGLNPSTFIYTIGKRHLISTYRPAWGQKKAGRKWWKEQVRRRAETDIEPLDTRGPVGLDHLLLDLNALVNMDKPDDEWLAGVMLAARQAFPAKTRAGQRFFSRDQLIGLAALRARHAKKSAGQFIFYLDCRPDLRRILRIKKIPSRRTLDRLRAMLNSKVATAFLEPERDEVAHGKINATECEVAPQSKKIPPAAAAA